MHPLPGLLFTALRNATRFTALFLLIAVTVPQTALGEPAIWKASRGEATIYIFGTIHLMNENVDWFSGDVKARFEAADTLILEVKGAGNPGPNVQALVVQLGFYRPPLNLAEELGPELYQRVSETATGVGLPEPAVRSMKPWMAMLAITVTSATKLGFLPQYGVDLTLEDAAEAAGKTVAGLETTEFQLRLFADLPADLQVAMLEATVDQLPELKDIFESMRDAWLAGEVEELGDIMNEGFAGMEEAEQIMLRDRNVRWVAQIDQLLNGEGTWFMAVGTGHLAGQYSFIDMLEEAGINITRE